MAAQVWIDGRFYDKDEAKVSVFDHGVLYGDGVFEGIRIYHGKIFRLKKHLDRLYDSAKAIWLDIPLSKKEMAETMIKCVKHNGLTAGYIRLLVTRGKGDLGLDPRKCPKPSVVVIADTIQLYPEEFYAKGLEVVTGGTPVNHRENLSPRIKSLNYLAHILAKIEGIQAGVHEVLMLDHEGFVAECTGDNIFAVCRPDDKSKGRVVVRTPHENAGLLKGVTRDAVIELAEKAGLDMRETMLTRYDLYTAEEIFLTGSGAEIISVVKLDGRIIGDGKPGPVTKQLLAAFRELTASEPQDIIE